MLRNTSLLLLLAASALSVAQEPVPGAATLPPTALDLESNNPAKAAVKAKEAQQKERAEQKAATEEAQDAPSVPFVDSAELAQRVGAALLKDARTAKLGVAVKPEDGRLVGLHGSVPSVESRTAVIDVATKVAGVLRVKSYLVVRKQN